MKKLFALLLTLISLSVTAQTWRPTENLPYYNGSPGGVYFPVGVNGVERKVDSSFLMNLVRLLGLSSGSATWGGIGGSLANQTDLNSALAGKASTASFTTVSTRTDSIVAALKDTLSLDLSIYTTTNVTTSVADEIAQFSATDGKTLKRSTITGIGKLAAGVLTAATAGTDYVIPSGSVATLTTPRSVYGNNFDGSTALSGIIGSAFGGTGNGFTAFTGPTTSAKTFTLPNASAAILTDNAVVTGAQGGTGVNNLGTITLGGNLTTSGANAVTFTTTGSTNITLPTTGTVATVNDANNSTIKGLSALGSSIKAITLGINYVLENNYGINLENTSATFTAIYLDVATSITGVKTIMKTQGVYTASTYNGVALYSVSGGTLTLVASSTDDGNIWKAATGSVITKAFTTPYSAPAGIYYAAVIYNRSAETTAPQLAHISTAYIPNLNSAEFTNSRFICGKYYPGTAFQSTVTAATIAASSLLPDPAWMAIY